MCVWFTQLLMRFVFKLYSSRKYLTCDHASIFFRGGKERLIQLLDYSSAAPICQRECRRCHPQIRMNEAELPEIASWARITQGTNSVNLHAMLYSTADKNMVYFVKRVLLLRSWWVSFRSRTRNAIFMRLACPLVKVPFHFLSQQITRSSAVVFDVALAV